VRLLLDAHALLWAHDAPERLQRGQGALIDRSDEPSAPAATAWEIATKAGLGRLVLPEAATTRVPSRTAAIGAAPLPIDQVHALAVADPPRHHRDPFDRLLVARARAIDASVVTADAAFEAYDVDVVPV
jgi:PIN domain nuclease of toxin-antitoxin system